MWCCALAMSRRLELPLVEASLSRVSTLAFAVGCLWLTMGGSSRMRRAGLLFRREREEDMWPQQRPRLGKPNARQNENQSRSFHTCKFGFIT